MTKYDPVLTTFHRGRLQTRVDYWRRVSAAYLTSRKSQLTFWHEQPSRNPEMSTTTLGQYYMPFVSKANYPGTYDADGIPMLDYQGVVGLQYNPIAIAQYGLGNYNLWVRTGLAQHWEKCQRAADWLVTHQEQNPWRVWVWNHYFDWDYRQMLKAPWYSALAQGQGMSLLVRVWRETKRAEYHEAAERALASFVLETGQGGVLFVDRSGDKWFEEYLVPPPPTHVLNGFIWASWGLYDHYLATGSTLSKGLFDDAVETLKRNLHLFDTGYWSLYELSGTRMRMLASPFYHALHLAQLEVMCRLTGESIFSDYATRWLGYQQNFVKRTFALAYKCAFKLAYY